MGTGRVDYTPPAMTTEQLEALLARIAATRIGVIGDYCLDAYWTLDASLSEISVETGLATRPVRSQRYSLGGAGNVVNNLVALGVRTVRAFGVVGNDPFGREMMRILGGCGCRYRRRPDAGPRLEHRRVHQARAGRGGAGQDRLRKREQAGPVTGTALIDALRRALDEMDLVIVNQQLLHGIHTPELRGMLADLIRGAHRPFICDSRSFSDSYTGAMRKLNDREALRLVRRAVGPRRSRSPRGRRARGGNPVRPVENAGLPDTRSARHARAGTRAAFTRCRACRSWAGSTRWAPATARLAGIAAATAAGSDAVSAATLGQLRGKRHREEALHHGHRQPGGDPRHRAGRRLCLHPGAGRGPAGRAIPRGHRDRGHGRGHRDAAAHARDFRQRRHHLHPPGRMGADHGAGDDPLRSRRGVEDGGAGPFPRRAGAGAGVHRRHNRECRPSCRCTAWWRWCASSAIVPAAEVKTAEGYKDVYNRELLAMVSRRIAKLHAGELCVDDYTLKGAIPLLNALHAAGVKLHLASGTDEADLLSEAEALGHAAAFRRADPRRGRRHRRRGQEGRAGKDPCGDRREKRAHAS